MPENAKFRISEEKRRILLVEDEIINREILKHSLNENYEIIIAQTGKEAMEIIREQYETLSIVLLDLNLPDVKGIEILRKIKHDPLYSHLPVIVMTADNEAEVECLTLGAIDFIPKPYPSSKVILARIQRTVELSEDRDIIHWTERDHLTGLYNKEFFYHYAVQLDLYHKQTPTDAIVLDINHFHMINDRYGKAQGDEVLKLIARKAKSIIDKIGGIICRNEADTFMLYCPHCSDYRTMLDKISHALDDELGEKHIRLRMGVYSNVDKTLDIESRFDRAKMAADAVKENLAEPIGFYDNSMRESEIFSEQLINDFHTAINEKQFVLFYQPKYNIQQDEPVLVSAEALVRWKHPELGMVSPGIFIPLFEKNGLIQELDRYVWSRAAEQICEWKERLGTSVPVSVNVSRVDLYDSGLVDRLLDIVRVNRLEFDDILLEITETAYTDNAQELVDKVNELRELGFRIEMDDFGSGYSSLSMLSYMPIDALKLDMQFVQNAFKERKDTRLLEAMIQLASSFEFTTVAEGVETAEQAVALKMMGCDIIQGYYFSPPIPAEKFEKLLTEKTEKITFKKSDKQITAPGDNYTYDALHDSLTGLYNYSAFEIFFRDADQNHIAIIIADIENYEKIKKEKGKKYADELICRVSKVLKTNFRSVDHVCRLNENEFVVIVTRVTSAVKGLLFSRINAINNSLKEEDGGIEPVSLNMGVAFSDNEKSEDNIFRCADTALKRMKEIKDAGYAVY